MVVVTQERVERTGSGQGLAIALLAVIVLALLAFIFFYNGLSYLHLSVPTGGTQINVPDKINVNVNKGQ